ncbi:copper homeostasis protein CutC [Nocardioides mesophilus]|uniref:Copper homeostasis protein cutC homolog n=1 Tax=Nocardioides mesophilus TaxID=433659 RepID=A0A7G9RDX8_9ACTN|nr:copper homeostasis protein CutC [Nocardioides mesophilus]QNN53803.1 copper homeostasis protein CutC [Nocardioides mesophilus]
MSIVSTPPQTDQPRPHRAPLLEVVVLHPRDVPGADEGGADRVLLLADPELGGTSPEPALVSSVCRETELPVRVVLRLSSSSTTTGAELVRLVGLAESYRSVGAEGVAFGFLDDQLEVDVEVCAHLAGQLPGLPWTFHRVFDDALETARAWREVSRLPGLDAVLTAGSVLGLDSGLDDLTARAAASPGVAALVMASGGLRGEHVPWLVRAGIRQFQVATSVRPGGSWQKAYVDAGHVRSWRMLVDDAVAHVERLEAGRSAG